MLCSECGKREASVHSVSYINGVKTESHLCQECAQKHSELQNLYSFSAGDFIKNFFHLSGFPNETVSYPSCKTCGITLADFRNTGRLGCPDCYDAFRGDVIPVIESIHGNAQHVGEMPAQTGEDAQRRKKIEDLKQQLSKAVASEDFEQAAKLRDEINELKGGEK